MNRLDELLAALPSTEPDALHTGRVRARCHRILARRQNSHAEVERSSHGRGLFAAVVVGAFCLIYLSAILLMSLRLRGLF
jgi:hypothetical protein